MSFVNLLDIIYPVGSVYFSTSAISPAESIGGTWTQVQNRYIFAGVNLEQGGSANHTHEPHLQAALTTHGGKIYYAYDSVANVDSNNWTTMWYIGSVDSSGNYTSNENTGIIVYGNVSEEDNNPLYQSFYCWYRTA